MHGGRPPSRRVSNTIIENKVEYVSHLSNSRAAPPRVGTLAPSFVIALLTMGAVESSAACTMSPSPGDQIISAPSAIFVPSRLAVGAVIETTYTSTPLYSHPPVGCSTWNLVHDYTRVLTLWKNSIYHTNVVGVGVSIVSLDAFTPGFTLPYSESRSSSLELRNAGFVVAFVKTGTIVDGVLTPGRYGQVTINGAYSTSIALPAITFTAGPAICDLSAMADVSLGEIAASAFSGPGSTTGWTSFSMATTGCYQANTISVKFTGIANAQDPTAFASTGTATGVGIELRSDDGQLAIPNAATPVTFAAISGPAAYGLKARVKQTGSEVMAGSIAAAITVNVTYN